MSDAERRFRFGVAAAGAPTGAAWREKARRAEALGYDILLVPDHFGDQFAPSLAVLAAAEATTRLRVGSFVYDTDFRHPAVLAKEAATLDLLTDGRFELGLGAGWLRAEYEQTGIPFAAAGVRLARMRESVRVLKGLWAEGPFSFRGEHYQLAGLTGHPRPARSGGPPLFIGGGGRRLLEFAAGAADIIGFAPGATATGALDVADASPAALDRKVAWVRAAAGERFAALELNAIVFVTEVTDQPEAAAAPIAAQFNMAPDALLASPYILIGTVDGLVAELEARRARFGLTYHAIFEPSMEAFAPVVARLAGR